MGFSKISFNNKARLSEAIKNHEDFDVIDTNRIQDKAVAWLENEIEKNGMKCRIYTGYRKALLAAALIPTGITQIAAAATGIAMAVHNVMTKDPDYEICKEAIGDGIEVKYMNPNG